MKIAFVLGAGASKDFGYPLGSELKAYVLTELEKAQSTMRKMLQEIGHQDVDLTEFRRTLYRSDHDTIDQFIAAHRRHPELQRITREAIVLAIADHEQEGALFGRGAHWYKRFIDFVRTKPTLLHRNTFTFFTFNYDRSMEFYLHEAVHRGGGDFSESIVEDFFLNNFIHIHGTIGLLPWQIRSGGIERDYGVPVAKENLKALAQSIITPEQESTLSGDLKQRLIGADLVVIMGFGFHKQNMAKIHFDELLKRPKESVLVIVNALPLETRDFLSNCEAIKVVDTDCLNAMANFVRDTGVKL